MPIRLIVPDQHTLMALGLPVKCLKMKELTISNKEIITWNVPTGEKFDCHPDPLTHIKSVSAIKFR